MVVRLRKQVVFTVVRVFRLWADLRINRDKSFSAYIKTWHLNRVFQIRCRPNKASKQRGNDKSSHWRQQHESRGGGLSISKEYSHDSIYFTLELNCHRMIRDFVCNLCKICRQEMPDVNEENYKRHTDASENLHGYILELDRSSYCSVYTRLPVSTSYRMWMPRWRCRICSAQDCSYKQKKFKRAPNDVCRFSGKCPGVPFMAISNEWIFEPLAKITKLFGLNLSTK